MDIAFWEVFAWQLQTLIEGAPMKRLRIIDMNQTVATINLK